MKKLTIDRFDGIYAICSDSDQKYFAIEVTELPEGAAVGSTLQVDDETGTLVVDTDKAPADKKVR